MRCAAALLLCLCAGAATNAAADDDDAALAAEAVTYLLQHTERSLSLHPFGHYPTRTQPLPAPDSSNGTLLLWETGGPSGWTSGFWPGLFWQLYRATGPSSSGPGSASERNHDSASPGHGSGSNNNKWLSRALDWTEALRAQQFRNSSHDVGFIIGSSFGKGLALGALGDNASAIADWRSVVSQAAESLASRFDPRVGCTMSWNPGAHCKLHPEWRTNYTVIIDNMMNLELLFLAAQPQPTAPEPKRTAAQQRLYDVATSHANKTAANHVRADGTTYHVVDYDAETGAVRHRCAAAGYADNSTWARGQAWALYGFTMSYRFTRDPAYLATATATADAFVEAVGARFDDAVPFFDFDVPGNATAGANAALRDASAAAIAASGLLELARHASPASPRRAALYGAFARRMLRSLVRGGYRSDFAAQEGAVAHCDGGNLDVSWADYYLAEACARLVNASAL